MDKGYIQPPFNGRVGKPRSSRISFILLILSVAAVAAFTLLTCHFDFLQPDVLPNNVSFSSTCGQPHPPAARSNFSERYDSHAFKMKSARRLAGAVKIPTMSYDDMGPVDTDERWAPFKDFHKYLRDTFPLVHAHAIITSVAKYSLIYVFPGSVTTLKPLMLTAHMDVVPSVTSLDRWTYPPFSGKIDGDWIYGRGSSDCKNNLIGILTAMESLIEAHWTPQRTIIFAFGQDEEISGPRGAYSIGKHLEAQFGQSGIALIVDEGGMGLDTIYGREFALPGVAEKGHINIRVEVDMLGGHSSVPSDHTTIGILSKIVSAVEDSHVFQPHLERASPIWGYLTCLARHGDDDQVPSWIKKSIFSKRPDMSFIAREFAKTSAANRYLVQTSKAPTIFNAGLKSNALAESAVVTFNSRIEMFSSSAQVRESYYNLIKPIAESYSLLLDGLLVSSEPSIGNITVNTNEGSEPSPISPFSLDSAAWKIFSRAVQASFGQDVMTAPSAMTGNTDTRHYYNLTRNIYRWSPARIGTRLNAHTVDEKIMINTHIDGIRFYTELIIQADSTQDNST